MEPVRILLPDYMAPLHTSASFAADALKAYIHHNAMMASVVRAHSSSLPCNSAEAAEFVQDPVQTSAGAYDDDTEEHKSPDLA